MNNAFKKRIDELGRVVIPKQIRQDLKINNFDELEIFINENNIVIKKNIGLSLYKEKLINFMNFIKIYCKFDVCIYENNNLVCASFNNKSLNNNQFEYNTIFSLDDNFGYKVNIIIDSNYIGDIIFIKNELSSYDVDNIKIIKNIFIDLIK